MVDWKDQLREIKEQLPKSPADMGKTRAPAIQFLQQGNTRKKANSVRVVRRPTSEPVPRANSAASKAVRPSGTLPPQLTARADSPANRQSVEWAVPGNRPVEKEKVPKLESPAKPEPVPTEFSGIYRPVELTRQKYFKHPDVWVKEGSLVQLQGAAGKKAIDVVIGLDFGTSFTKAAIGMMDQILPVTWEGVSGYPNPYLLPSEYSVMDDGVCLLGQAPTAMPNQIMQRLKHPFIDSAVSSEPKARASIFIGLVLQYIRAWTFNNHATKIGGRTIRWMLNIGAPSNGLESGNLEQTYRTLGTSAWYCSQLETISAPQNILEIVREYDSTDPPEGLQGVDVLPEFVGQIAGYVKSAQRQSGLHALVDVGGGTLDVVTFIVNENDGEDSFPFLVPKICALGTQMLNLNRFIGVEAEQNQGGQGPDELEPVLEGSEFADRFSLEVSHVEMRDQLFWDKVSSLVQGVFHETKLKRDPNSEHWTKKSLPIFLTGGGARSEGFAAAVRRGGERVAKTLRLLPLPSHRALFGFKGSQEDYQRISVACGLAVDAMNLGSITPAKDVEDINNTYRILRTSHEDIYGS